MPRTYKKVERPYNKVTIELAVQEVKDGSSIRAASAKHHMSFSYLRKHVKKSESEEYIKDDMRVIYFFYEISILFHENNVWMFIVKLIF